MNLPCMNCKQDVAQNEVKFFGEVFLCPGCHTMAESFYARIQRDMKHLLTMAKEAIRVALVQGDFHPSSEQSKRSVLEEVLRLEEAREARDKNRGWQKDKTQSSENMLPHVRTLAALANDSSNTGYRQGSG